MKVSYDQIGDAAYIALNEKQVKRTQRVTNVMNVDYAEDGTIVGIELLNLSHYASDTRVEIKYSTTLPDTPKEEKAEQVKPPATS